jgi:homoserine dehydrogenase
MALADNPGALAKIATVLGEAGINIYLDRQYEHDEPSALVLIVTHKTTCAALDQALTVIESTGVWRVYPSHFGLKGFKDNTLQLG